MPMVKRGVFYSTSNQHNVIIHKACQKALWISFTVNSYPFPIPNIVNGAVSKQFCELL